VSYAILIKEQVFTLENIQIYLDCSVFNLMT